MLVLETGAPVLTPWRGQLAGLLEAWYPGEDGGTAIAHLLFGDVDPSGRLPATFPKRAGDIPTAHGGTAEYPGRITPTRDCIVYTDSVPCPYYQENYSEGVMVGYRSYQDRHITPAYPFGFGLSYTRFHFGRLRITRAHGAHRYLVHLAVTNTGSRSGDAVPELYVSLPSRAGIPEPPWQLKGYAKILLSPGQRAEVTIPLDARSFSFWSRGQRLENRRGLRHGGRRRLLGESASASPDPPGRRTVLTERGAMRRLIRLTAALATLAGPGLAEAGPASASVPSRLSADHSRPAINSTHGSADFGRWTRRPVGTAVLQIHAQ